MIKKISRNALRYKRHRRLRKRIKGTPTRPRLSVFRSIKHIYAQVVNDEEGHTLVSASTLDKELRGKYTDKKEMARKLGELIGQRCIANGIEQVVFDRGGYKYHGRIKALAEGARSAGVLF